MAAALVDLLVCAGHADERRGGATHEGHQTASALVVVLVTGGHPGWGAEKGGRAVVCAPGRGGQPPVGSWWGPAPGGPHAVAAPRGWQACGGVPPRQAAWPRRPRRRAGCATATRTGPGHADPRGGQILRAGFAAAARQPPGGAGDLADRRPAGPPPLASG